MGDLGLILGWKDPLEKQMATHSRILAWRIPWTEEPGGYSPWSHKESDTTEWLTFTSSLSGCFILLETTAKQQEMFKSLMIKEMQKKWDFTSHNKIYFEKRSFNLLHRFFFPQNVLWRILDFKLLKIEYLFPNHSPFFGYIF